MSQITILCLFLLANSRAQEQSTSQVADSSETLYTEEISNPLNTHSHNKKPHFASDVDLSGSEDEDGTDLDEQFAHEHDDDNPFDDDEIDPDRKHLILQKPRAIVMRCSRRFTPGSCAEPVTSVWTYVFDQQNCTERLGCQLSTRENRFRSYNRCNRLCMQLSNVYTQVLDMHKDHGDSNKRWFGLNMRKSDRLRWDQNKDTSNLPPLAESESENEGRPVAREYYDYIERGKPMSYDDYNFVLEPDELPLALDMDEFGVNPNELEDFERNFNL